MNTLMTLLLVMPGSIFVAIGLYIYSRKKKHDAHARYNKLRVQRLAAIRMSGEDADFFNRYDPSKYQQSTLLDLWDKVYAPMQRIGHRIRNFFATFYTEYNPLALKDRVAELEKQLKTKDSEVRSLKSYKWDLEAKLEMYEENCPEETERQKEVKREVFRKQQEATDKYRKSGQYETPFV